MHSKDIPFGILHKENIFIATSINTICRLSIRSFITKAGTYGASLCIIVIFHLLLQHKMEYEFLCIMLHAEHICTISKCAVKGYLLIYIPMMCNNCLLIYYLAQHIGY